MPVTDFNTFTISTYILLSRLPLYKMHCYIKGEVKRGCSCAKSINRLGIHFCTYFCSASFFCLFYCDLDATSSSSISHIWSIFYLLPQFFSISLFCLISICFSTSRDFESLWFWYFCTWDLKIWSSDHNTG